MLLFALFDLLGSNILISNADLLEVWRKQRNLCEKQNAVYTFISNKIDGSVLEENRRYLKDKTKIVVDTYRVRNFHNQYSTKLSQFNFAKKKKKIQDPVQVFPDF